MTIGERLLKLRREKNISQEELANILDVSRQTVSKWETDQSSPDFDKIVPLCEYFGISSDELLTGNSNIQEAKKDNVKSNFARNIAIAVLLYIVAIPTMIVCAAQFQQEILGLSLFFVLIAIGTAMLIYNGIYYSKESSDTKKQKDNSLLTQIINIINIIGVTIYLLVSFLTMAWHITWIIFLIIALVREIAKLVFNVLSQNQEAGDSNE